MIAVIILFSIAFFKFFFKCAIITNLDYIYFKEKKNFIYLLLLLNTQFVLLTFNLSTYMTFFSQNVFACMCVNNVSKWGIYVKLIYINCNLFIF